MKKWKIASEDNLYYEITDSEGQLVGYVAKFDEDYKDEERLKLNLVLSASEMFQTLNNIFEYLHNDQGYSLVNPNIKELENIINKVNK